MLCTRANNVGSTNPQLCAPCASKPLITPDTIYPSRQVYPFLLIAGIGGCCDCGQAAAWTRPVICSIHTTQTSTEAVINSGDMPLDAGMKDALSAVLDYILEVMHGRAARNEEPTVIHEQGRADGIDCRI
jgi:hypothetical protein